jgi:Leu/Phe-tRNA-protein transferase
LVVLVYSFAPDAGRPSSRISAITGKKRECFESEVYKYSEHDCCRNFALQAEDEWLANAIHQLGSALFKGGFGHSVPDVFAGTKWIAPLYVKVLR